MMVGSCAGGYRASLEKAEKKCLMTLRGYENDILCIIRTLRKYPATQCNSGIFAAKDTVIYTVLLLLVRYVNIASYRTSDFNPGCNLPEAYMLFRIFLPVFTPASRSFDLASRCSQEGEPLRNPRVDGHRQASWMRPWRQSRRDHGQRKSVHWQNPLSAPLWHSTRRQSFNKKTYGSVWIRMRQNCGGRD